MSFDGRAGLLVQDNALESARQRHTRPRCPAHREVVRTALSRKQDRPERCVRAVLREMIFCQCQKVARWPRRGGQRQLRAHPARDLVLNISEGARHTDDVEDPAGQQTCPAVEPNHRLAKAVFQMNRARPESGNGKCAALIAQHLRPLRKSIACERGHSARWPSDNVRARF